MARPGPGLLKPALVALALAANPHTLWGTAQAQPGGFPFAVPLPDLGAPSPASALAVQSVHQALGRANTTGDLPSLANLNTLLAVTNPQRFSILGTLPPAAADAPAGQPSPTYATPAGGGVPASAGERALPESGNTLEVPASQAVAPLSSQDRLDQALTAARKILRVAQLTETSNILQTVANQLFSDSLLLRNQTVVSTALQVVAFDLAALGFGLASSAAGITTVTAQETLDALEKQAEARSAAAGPGTPLANTAASASEPAKPGPANLLLPPPLGPGGLLSPDVIYGTWERLENTPSGNRVTYKFSPSAWVKTSTTLEPGGEEAVATEVHPGAVMAYVSYQRRPGQASLDAVLGKIKVNIVLEQLSGRTTTLAFAYLQAEGSPDGDSPGLVLDVLVEEEGDRKAFVRSRGPG
jgi:hypothetical protein